MGLPNYEGQKFAETASNTISPGMLNRSASEALLQGPPPPMAMSTGVVERKRMGPHWPPKTAKKPDSLSTRETLFPGGHRTFVDLYSADRPAARGWASSHKGLGSGAVPILMRDDACDP